MNTKTVSTSQNQKIVDLKAGLVVFLIALPLSLGISIASGAPSSAGLISAILGGLIGAYTGGAHLTINGPAAGLIVVVLSAIQNLGEGDSLLGFKRMLACIIVVGILQILSGLVKAGKFASLFPLSVVHGMLTAIGLIIMIKQFHVFVGHKAQGSIIQSIGQIPNSIENLNSQATLIAMLGLIILLLYPKLKIKFATYIPSSLIVALMGIGLGFFLKNISYVNIPTNREELIIFPVFDKITSLQSILAIITIYFVASLESILSASAVDKLDPWERETDFNKELWSKGLVNLFCGCLGGLPIIAEIVRSSANISQGAKTPLSNFSHSIYILIFLVLFPNILNSIPLAALAATLVLIGYRLASPKQFFEMWNLGKGSFYAFITTIIVTLAEDLLVGVFAGIIVEISFSLLEGARLKDLFNPEFYMEKNGDKAILNFAGSLTFFSILKQKSILNQANEYQKLEINFTNLKFIDVTSLSFFAKESTKLQKMGKQVMLTIPQEYQNLFNQIQGH